MLCRHTLRAAAVALLVLASSSPAGAAQKQIGQSCSSDNSSIDWDTIAQCNNTSFVSGPLILGAMTNPPYSATTCTGTNAGMLQWTGSSFQFCNGASWALALDASGNVGIGTTSPLKQLEVTTDGGIAFSAVSAFSATATDYPTFWMLRGRGTHASPSPVLSGDDLGRVRFAGQYDTTVGHFNTTAYIGALAAENFSNPADGSSLVFYTTPVTTATPTEKMRIDSAGNVGIGTTSPAYPLHVKTGTDLDLGVTNDGTAVFIGAINDAASSNIPLRLQGTDVRLYYNGGSGAAEGMRLTTTGSVGIGTTAPNVPLHVYGAATISTDARRVLKLEDTTSFAAGVGAGIQFGQK